VQLWSYHFPFLAILGGSLLLCEHLFLSSLPTPFWFPLFFGKLYGASGITGADILGFCLHGCCPFSCGRIIICSGPRPVLPHVCVRGPVGKRSGNHFSAGRPLLLPFLSLPSSFSPFAIFSLSCCHTVVSYSYVARNYSSRSGRTCEGELTSPSRASWYVVRHPPADINFPQKINETAVSGSVPCSYCILCSAVLFNFALRCTLPQFY